MTVAPKIKTEPINSLEDFFCETDNFSKRIHELKCKPKKGSGVLYRGQADATWPLETTLERYVEKYFRYSEYFAFLQKLNLPALDFLKPLTSGSFKNDFEVIDPDILAAFAYVRHIGGPSPLLDWTHDKDVALFFAFHNVPDTVKYVSIFIYLDACLPGRAIASMPRVPLIRAVPHEQVNKLLTHYNHMLQKSEYTYCIFGGGNADVIFAPHEERFSAAKEIPALGGDLCVKFILPIELREKAFEYLKGKGINEYTLFKSDGAYVRTKWVELFGVKKTEGKKELEIEEFLRLNGINHKESAIESETICPKSKY
ncbi:MAG: FRG domain-containing protein [Candidatus Omnitrophica bacterium]|nr:FRG domain-containing protein [Candidatus Omnitrophota bacterium]